MSDDRDEDEKPASTGDQLARKENGQFRPGVSGNPLGRKPGSRNKLTQDFISELADDFEDHGRAAIVAMRETEPAKYVKVIADLLPRDVQITARPFTEFTNDDLLDALRRIEAQISVGGDPRGAGTTIEGESARVVHAVPEAAGVSRGWSLLPRTPDDGGESGREDD